MKPRILYIGPVPPERGGAVPGGVATYCWDLACQAGRHGYDAQILTQIGGSTSDRAVTLIAHPNRNKLGETLRGLMSWIGHRQLRQLAPLGFRERLRVFRSTAFLAGLVKERQPDLVHLHSLHNLHGLGLKLLFPSLPIVITDHGFWQGITKEKDILRIQLIAERADYILFGSQWAREQFRRYHLLSPAGKRVIINPQDPGKIPFLDRGEIQKQLQLGDRKIILFSGVGEPVTRKGLDILLAAVERDNALKDSCKTIVITNEAGIEFAADYIGRPGLELNILGPQPWARIIEYYNSANVFVMPSRSESFGLVYAEALLGGAAIIGFAPIVEELEKLLNIRVGERFDPRKETAADLAEKIKSVLRDDYDRSRLRKKLIEHLSWEVLFPEFEAVYRSLLTGKP